MIAATSPPAMAATAPALVRPLRIAHRDVHWRILAPPQGDAGIYASIVLGPDGAIWLTDSRGRLVRVDQSGSRTAMTLTFSSSGATHTFLPAYAAVGADGKFYMTGCVDVPESCAFVGAADTAGRLSVYPIPSGSSARFSGVALGPDGNVWFTDASGVGNISPTGVISEYPYPTGERTNELSGIAAGADGNLWFTEVDKLVVGKVDPQSGTVSEYSIKAWGIDCGLSGMAAGPDGNLYAACGQGFVQITTQAAMYYYESLMTLSDGAQEIAPGAGALLWCQFLSMAGRFDPSQNLLVLYTPPDGALTLYGSATAADSRQWILAENGTVYVIGVQQHSAPSRSPR